jgi:hypothetical protein
MFQANVVEKIKTHVYVQQLFSFNRAVYEKMWENGVEWGKDTDESMAHAHCMLDT